MEKIKKRIANLKVAGKLKVYRMTVLVMTLFLPFLTYLFNHTACRSHIRYTVYKCKFTQSFVSREPVSYTHLSIVKHILKLHRIKPYTEYSGGRLIIGFYI